ncbi:MAG: M28 family peptidase [Terrimicrobiaceae bacterium]|nr:M28 family peptidase [Terrimicrobiaceae bacterium]
MITSNARALRNYVEELTTLGERSTRLPKALDAAAGFVEREFANGGYDVHRQSFPADGVECRNVEAIGAGFSPKVPHLLLGAHYDSAPGTPGADDDASAVAILLALAGRFARNPGLERLRFVAFTNEEPPHFRTKTMGSRVFARACAKRGDAIEAMICLESLGVFSDEPDTQVLPVDVSPALVPPGFVPTVGNYIAVVGNSASMGIAGEFASSFRHSVPAIPIHLPEMELSDHVSFWDAGIPAIMLTDTALFRNLHYHLPTDTPEKLDYDRMALTAGFIGDAIERWLSSEPKT